MWKWMDASVWSERRVTRSGHAWRAALGFAAALLLAAAGAADAQTRATAGRATCDACHTDVEFLRGHVPTVARARELVVPTAMLQGSAHDGMGCAECHTGFDVFPHRPARTTTATCASCHEDEERDWRQGRHAEADTVATRIAGAERTNAACSSCHVGHDMAPVAALADGRAMLRMNASCTGCHQEYALPAADPHAAEVGCWTCHAPHEVHRKDSPRAAIAPARQRETCGACHDTASTNWASDAHGQKAAETLARNVAASVLPLDRAVPVCTGCHIGHRMIAVADSTAFMHAMTDRCAVCHQDFASTYFGTYHGKATVLGSQVAAGCHHCHGSHDVFAQDDPRSMIHEAKLLETCGACHPNARPAFILYDSHPELWNWRRNPILTGSFLMMNSLLAFVFIVFGSHTVLWWIRLIIDKRRGIVHGPGMHGGHGAGHGHGQGRADPHDDGAHPGAGGHGADRAPDEASATDTEETRGTDG
jgi:hypothetical protein